MQQEDLTTCVPGEVWDTKKHKCLQRHSGVLPDSELTEYAYALAKADRFQEAIDVLDWLDNPNTPRALNYRGYATRKLGRTDEGIGYYLKSVALDPRISQVREYLGEAYVIEGKFDLAKDQLATIEKICGQGLRVLRRPREGARGRSARCSVMTVRRRFLCHSRAARSAPDRGIRKARDRLGPRRSWIPGRAFGPPGMTGQAARRTRMRR